jgi:hypothetical protein
MSFQIFCEIKVKNENQPTQLAGCGILLVYKDEELKESNARTFKYGLGSNAAVSASLIAMRLALSSIKPAFRKQSVELFVSPDLFKAYQLEELSSDWERKSKSELERWMGYYKDLKITENAAFKHQDILSELSLQGCESQTAGDSGTIYWE